MKIRIPIYLLLALIVCSTLDVKAQLRKEIFLKNPSFEDNPHAGTHRNHRIVGWQDCGASLFPRETPPDIHPVDFWEVTMGPSHGDSYLGMVVRNNESWESVSQRLTSDIEADKCYVFRVDLARSSRYVSGTRTNQSDQNFIEPAVLRVWGSSGYCGSTNRELLAETPPIKNHQWDSYQLKFSPRKNYRFIVLEAFYVTPTPFAYNGHILLDNAQSILEVGCDEDIPLIKPKEDILAEVEPEPKNTGNKPNKKIEKPKPNPDSKEVVAAKPIPPIRKSRFLNDEDVKKLKEGQVIKIEKLLFEADTSSISNSSYAVLDEVYYFLHQNESIVVEIGGHTNGQPSHRYCDKLSTERARAVASYLIKKGIPSKQIEFKGYGKRKPIASNHTKSGRTKNQR